MSSVTVEIDDELLAFVQERAAVAGKPREEVMAEAVRRGLASERLRATLASVRARSDLSEQEAMQLALDEQRAARAERRASDSG